MKKALLISESSIYKNHKGELVAKGGGEMCVHNIAKFLLKIDIQPTVFAIQEFEDQAKEEIIDNVLYKRIKVSSKTSFKIIGYLKQAIKESKNYDFIFLNQFTPHLILPWIKDTKNIAIIHDVYQPLGNFFWIKQYGFFNGLMGNLIEKIQLYFDKKYAKKIMTVSDFSEEKIISILGERTARKITKNPFSINPNSYTSINQKEDFILFVGRFIKYKHPEHVLFALKKIKQTFPNYKAIFVIPRTEKNELKLFKEYQNHLRLTDNDIILKHNCNNEETKTLFSKAKILIHPSFVEGQGIVLLEALASKTPVVAYNLPPYKNILINGKNSLLADIWNTEQLATSCIEILNNYGYFQNNCHITLHNFSEEKFLNKMKELCS